MCFYQKFDIFFPFVCLVFQMPHATHTNIFYISDLSHKKQPIFCHCLFCTFIFLLPLLLIKIPISEGLSIKKATIKFYIGKKRKYLSLWIGPLLGSLFPTDSITSSEYAVAPALLQCRSDELSLAIYLTDWFAVCLLPRSFPHSLSLTATQLLFCWSQSVWTSGRRRQVRRRRRR